MKLSLKLLSYSFLVILILFVIVVALTLLLGNRALKIGIETAASKALNVGVSIDDVDLSIMGGKIGFQNLSINNPPGYQHDKLLELRDAQIAVNIKSLLTDSVKIKEIKLDDVNVVLEQRGVSSNNLQDVIKAISAKPDVKGENGTAGKKLHIDNLEITNVKVKVKLLPIPGRTDTIPLKLSTIKMTNLGSDDNLSAADLSVKILIAIANGIAKEGVGVLPEDIVNTMKSTLDKTMDVGKIASKEGKKLIDAGKDAGTELIEGFKGLLKPKKDKE